MGVPREEGCLDSSNHRPLVQPNNLLRVLLDLLDNNHKHNQPPVDLDNQLHHNKPPQPFPLLVLPPLVLAVLPAHLAPPPLARLEPSARRRQVLKLPNQLVRVLVRQRLEPVCLEGEGCKGLGKQLRERHKHQGNEWIDRYLFH